MPKETVTQVAGDKAAANAKANAAAAPAPAAVAPLPILRDSQIHLAGAGGRGDGNLTWQLTLKDDQNVSQLADPSFWKHLSPRLIGDNPQKPRHLWDLIEVRKPSEGGFWLFMIVRLSPGFVVVDPIAFRDPPNYSLPENCPLEMRWDESTHTHAVIKKRVPGSPVEIVSPGHPTKGEAVEWIRKWMATFGAVAA